MKTRMGTLFSIVLILCIGMVFVISGCGGKGAGGKDVYYCPMHPTYTSDRPGDCPICNMKLVKKESEREKPIKADEYKGHSGSMQGRAEEKTLQEVCVDHSCTMKDCPMHVQVALKPGERILCPICGEAISTTSGKVIEIPKKPGMPAGPTVMISAEKQQLIGVKTEPVKRIGLSKVLRASGKIAYDPELVVTQEEFIRALINEENMKDSPLKDVIERAKSLTDASGRKLRLLGMTDEQIAELGNAKKIQTNLYLPGKGESVWAYISIYEYEIGLVRAGDAVEIDAVAYPGEKFQGVVKSINPVLDSMTRTNQVRAEVANTEGKLKPEMFVRAAIMIDLGEQLALPESAVLDTGLRKIVYVSREGDLLESREVKLGQKAEGFYEVLEGLSEGDVVVTSGNFLIDSESKLKASASGAPEHQH